MAFAKACQAAGGGQGSSRKHCAIAFRPATKRPLPKIDVFFSENFAKAPQC